MVKRRIKSLQNQIDKITQMMIDLKTKSPEINQAVKLLTTKHLLLLDSLRSTEIVENLEAEE